MDTISSAEFRKVYAKLTRDTLVTVNGHVIGEWQPRGAVERIEGRPRTHTGHRDGNPGAASDRFRTRPFTPVPKGK